MVYRQEIPSGQTRGQLGIKQDIRRAFNVYLRNVWKNEKRLKEFMGRGLPSVRYPVKRSAPDDEQNPFYQTELCGFSWIPLVSRRNRLKVDLRIELLGESARVLKPKGDLDNRLKVVMDGLRMVRQSGEIEPADKGQGKNLFVLLEDDSLIRTLDVTATPSLGSPAEHRVTVDVTVRSDDWDRHQALPFL